MTNALMPACTVNKSLKVIKTVDIKLTDKDEKISRFKSPPVKMYLSGHWQYFTEEACKEIQLFLNNYFSRKQRLYSLDEIKNIINHWRQDQGSLFDEDTDIPRLIELFKQEGD